jgi:hypothetical protein
MSSYIDASHNVLYTLNPEKWMPDLDKSGRGDIVGYQEGDVGPARTTIREWCKANNRGLFAPTKCDLPISWKKDVFTLVRRPDKTAIQGTREVHQSAPQMGVPAKFNPARDFSYVGLKHTQTGKKILRINVHPVAGGTKLESDPDNHDTDQVSIWKDWGVGQYWLDVVSFVAGQMSRQEPVEDSLKSFWDIITLGGDFNAYLDRTERWYYPGALLPSLFVNDKLIKGLDHLMHAHGSDVKQGKRWTVAANSDHRIHFQERTIITVPDFPRQL